jgi:hypothetical protein
VTNARIAVNYELEKCESSFIKFRRPNSVEGFRHPQKISVMIASHQARI